MAASTKVTFKYDVLRDRVIKYHTNRLDELNQKLADLGSEENVTRQREQWRQEAERKVLALAERIKADKISDLGLSVFRIPDLPESDAYRRRDLERAIANRRATLERAKLKLDSITVSDDGTLALTSTQLENFFGIGPTE